MRRLSILFVAMCLFLAPAFSQKKETYRVRTVVIDPGHGGAKPGAQGGKTQEKHITLSIAKKFGKLIADNYPDVNVIYTRTSDVDISLAERAHIANRNKADLFISIHANSHPTAAPSGVETFVMGLSESRANLEVAKKENADILLESDYKSNEAYKGFDPNAPESFVMLAMFQNAFIDKSLNLAQAIQNQYKQNLRTINRGVKQAELFVLYKTTCPSVLTEVGFISNPAEEAFMISDEGQAKIAVSLFNAFMTYKAMEEGTNKIANPKIDLPGYKSAEKATPAKADDAQAEAAATVADKAPATEGKVESEATVPPANQRPVPTRELAPRMEIAENEATPPKQEPAKQEPVKQEPAKPEAIKQELAKPEAQAPKSSQSSAGDKLVPPANSAAPDAEKYYTVQFLTSADLLPAGSPAFKGLEDVEVMRNGQIYCYSVGHFATFSEASDYSREVRRATPFSDAWAVMRKAEPKQEQPKQEEAKAEPKQEQQPKQEEAKAEPKQEQPKQEEAKAEPKQEQPKPKTLAPEDKGVHYRIQFMTSTRLLNVGSPDLHGIRDIRHSRNGKFYIYSCGNYKTLAEARKRLATIKSTTPFKDAYVYGIKDGRRFIVE